MKEDIQGKSRKVYGFVGDEARYIIFSTRDEADRYNKLYFNGKLRVVGIDVYENMEMLEKDEPIEHLERLCKEKAEVLYEIRIGDLPISVEDVWSPKIYTRFSLLQLRDFLRQVNDKLKKEYASPQEVNEDEIIRAKAGECEIQLSVKDYRKLNEVFNNACKRASVINAEIAKVLIEGMIDKREYMSIQTAAHIKTEHQLEDIPSCNFEMLDNGPCYEKDYLSLE